VLILPEPESLEKISRMYSLNRLLNSDKDWLAKAPYVRNIMIQLSNGKAVRPGSREYDQLNLHLLYRSMHQVNEACNKLWSTTELYHHAKKDIALCNSFSPAFLGSSTIPTLHYANCSAIISIMSLFGLGSWVKREKGLEFFNLIRTSDGMFLEERANYLNSLVGSAHKGWHWQVLETYRGLVTNGRKLPKIDLEQSRELLLARTRYHYDVLGHTTMAEVYGVDEYFKFLPTVVDSIFEAIRCLHAVVHPLPNKCDERFKMLRQTIPLLAREYGKTL